MKFPLYATVKVASEAEKAALDDALVCLSLAASYQSESQATALAMAYVTVSGKKVASGAFPEMLKRFRSELEIHSAPVSLYVMEAGEYRAKQRRSRQSTTTQR